MEYTVDSFAFSRQICLSNDCDANTERFLNGNLAKLLKISKIFLEQYKPHRHYHRLQKVISTGEFGRLLQANNGKE